MKIASRRPVLPAVSNLFRRLDIIHSDLLRDMAHWEVRASENARFNLAKRRFFMIWAACVFFGLFGSLLRDMAHIRI